MPPQATPSRNRTPSISWCILKVQSPHHEGGYAITPSEASGLAAIYSATSKFVALLASLTHGDAWVRAGQALAAPDTWSITVQELQRAKEEFMCHTTHELYDEMELWQWDEVQHNRWARALKASHRVGVRPIWYVEEADQEGKRLSWATATRSLRRLKANHQSRRQEESTQGARMAT